MAVRHDLPPNINDDIAELKRRLDNLERSKISFTINQADVQYGSNSTPVTGSTYAAVGNPPVQAFFDGITHNGFRWISLVGCQTGDTANCFLKFTDRSVVGSTPYYSALYTLTDLTGSPAGQNLISIDADVSGIPWWTVGSAINVQVSLFVRRTSGSNPVDVYLPRAAQQQNSNTLGALAAFSSTNPDP